MYHSVFNANFPHGIMFHHFHDDLNHKASQGSINELQFENIINFIGQENIVNPEEWMERLETGNIQKNHVCITFDDNLKSQIDIALKVLNKYSLKAFFFVNTAIFENQLDRLEIYRFFRENYFENLDLFYDKFFLRVRDHQIDTDIEEITNSLDFSKYKPEYLFYTTADRKFRYFRDELLGEDKYFQIMDNWMEEVGLQQETLITKLWFSEEDVHFLFQNKHCIGLHSHSHPTKLANLSFEEQRFEFSRNNNILSNITGKPIPAIAYPSGSYNNDTLKIAKDLDMKIGFADNINKGVKNNRLQIPRENHSNILKMI